jgi:putative hemolysin
MSISAVLRKSPFLKLLFAFCIAMLVGCASTTMAQSAPAHTPPGKIANPASINCVRQGGTLVIRKRGDGGEYGICVFADNRQCEEWTMFRGDCPVGGIDITGYLTPAARYCVITGGKYQVTGNGHTEREAGTCTLRNGRTCDARDYFSGKCSPK